MRIAIALACLACPLPAAAQIWDGGGAATIARPASGIGPVLGDVDRRIRDGRRSGQLSKRKARGFRRDADIVRDLHDRYATGGTSDTERAELEARSLALQGLVDAQRLSPPSPR